MPADSAACARALVHTRTLAHAHEHDGLQGLSDIGPYKIFFHFEAFVHESIIVSLPSPHL